MTSAAPRRLWVDLPALALLLLSLAGCQSTNPQLNAATAAFDQGDYRQAYQKAAPLAARDKPGHDVAAYLAGVSAQKLGDLKSAERHLHQASRSRDQAVAADALASLGLVHHGMGRHDQAARELTQAAQRLEGDQRAQAYFYAAVAQQKLSRWPQARTSLLLARGATRDPGLLAQIDEQLAVTGYTVQVGAFSNDANARRAAQALAAKATSLQLGPPRLVPGKGRDGSPLVLVQVGRFSSFDAANAARSRLGERGAIVVPLGR